MSELRPILATEIDQDSPLSGRFDVDTGNRDSVMENLRERDAYLYERLFRAQLSTDFGFFGPLTPDGVEWDAFQDPHDPLNVKSRGFRAAQLDHFRFSFSGAVFRPDITAPAGGAVVFTDTTDILGQVWLPEMSFWIDDGDNTLTTGTFSADVRVRSDPTAGAAYFDMVVQWTGVNVGADATAFGQCVARRYA